MSKLKKSEAFTAEREREIQQVSDLSFSCRTLPCMVCWSNSVCCSGRSWNPLMN